MNRNALSASPDEAAACLWRGADYDKIWGATSVIKLLCDSALTDRHMDHKDF